MARQSTPPEDAGHEPNLNQARHEPRGSAPDEDRTPALDRLAAAEPPGQPAPSASGAAAEELTRGPAPQSPVPDAPGVQVAAADSADGRVTRVRRVSNAVPGKPDGEVDTRS
jgi:hypothetical protein